jgi:hypothetical protein
MLRDRAKPLNREEAEGLAAAALGFIAADDERVARFLALSGIHPAELRQSAAEPGFLTGVLDFLLGDENLLLAFAGEASVPPERIGAAQRLLDGRR